MRLSDIEPEGVQWLWRSRIPRAKITLLVGDPGSGKSYLSLAVAAGITTGFALPDGAPNDRGRVVIANLEDGIADTLRVRAEAVGADLSRIHVVDGARDANGERVSFGLRHVADFAWR